MTQVPCDGPNREPCRSAADGRESLHSSNRRERTIVPSRLDPKLKLKLELKLKLTSVVLLLAANVSRLTATIMTTIAVARYGAMVRGFSSMLPGTKTVLGEQ